MLKDRLQQDLKIAMLGGDKARAEVLRGLKSAILYEEVAKNAREAGLDDQSIVAVIAREAKKRTESAEIYHNAGETARADAELAEKAIIEAYLPQQISDHELADIVAATIARLGGQAQLGQVIGAVRQEVGQTADGSRIATAVKTALQT